MEPDAGLKRLWEEHRKVGALIERLRPACAYVPRIKIGDWLGEFRAAFEAFRAHMIKLMALEERDGYMKGLLESRPNLSKQVARLGHEHHELTWLLTSINDAIAGATPEDPLLLLDCCKRAQNVLMYVEHHEKEESLIISTVYTSDLGGFD